MLILERNSRFHRSVDFYRSVPPKTEIVPFRSWGGTGTENGTERNGAEQERENTGGEQCFPDVSLRR